MVRLLAQDLLNIWSMSRILFKREFKTKIVFAFCLIVSMTFAYAAASQAKAPSSKSSEVRSLQLWDQSVQYQLTIHENARLPYDGESYAKDVDGKKVYHVSLNKVFFEREAKDLFRRLSNDSLNPSKANPLISNQRLMDLERGLLALRREGKAWGALNSDSLEDLRRLQLLLEGLAWNELFQSSLKRTFSAKQAEKLFVTEFTRNRLQTIEHHEASHVIDLMNSAKGGDSTEFERHSELNAFYTELVYGTHPLDVMSQAIAGFIDEMRQGKPVDFSIEKVATVVGFIKKCPKYASRLAKGKMSRCCLEVLAELSREDFKLAGQDLYRKNPLRSKQSLVSLR